eukprot:797574_1
MALILILILWLSISFVAIECHIIGSIVFLNTSGARISTTQYPNARDVASQLHGQFVKIFNVSMRDRHQIKYYVQSLEDPRIKLKVKHKYLSLKPFGSQQNVITRLKPVINIHYLENSTECYANDLVHKLYHSQVHENYVLWCYWFDDRSNPLPKWTESIRHRIRTVRKVNETQHEIECGARIRQSDPDRPLELFIASDIVSQYISGAFPDALNVILSGFGALTSSNYPILHATINVLLESLGAPQQIIFPAASAIHHPISPLDPDSMYPTSPPTIPPPTTPPPTIPPMAPRAFGATKIHIHYIYNYLSFQNHVLWWNTPRINNYFMVFGTKQRVVMHLSQHLGHNMIPSELSDYLYHNVLESSLVNRGDPVWMKSIYDSLKRRPLAYASGAAKRIGILQGLNEKLYNVEIRLSTHFHWAQYQQTRRLDYIRTKIGDTTWAQSTQELRRAERIDPSLIKQILNAVRMKCKLFGQVKDINLEGSAGPLIANEILAQAAKLNMGSEFHVIMYQGQEGTLWGRHLLNSSFESILLDGIRTSKYNISIYNHLDNIKEGEREKLHIKRGARNRH